MRRRPALAGLAFASVIALVALLGAAVAVMAYRISDEARRTAVTERGRRKPSGRGRNKRDKRSSR